MPFVLTLQRKNRKQVTVEKPTKEGSDNPDIAISRAAGKCHYLDTMKKGQREGQDLPDRKGLIHYCRGRQQGATAAVDMVNHIHEI